MLYLKNSLVNLIIILFSLFFLTISSADDNEFIFPKKKITTIKTIPKKQIKIEKNNSNKKKLTQNNLISSKENLKSKKIKTEKKKLPSTELPQKKPSLEINKKRIVKQPYLEQETIQVFKKEKILKESTKTVKNKTFFLYPSKKHLNYYNV